MSRLLTVIFLMLLFSPKIFSQTKDYKLVDKTCFADINSRLFKMLDTARPGMSLMDNVFKPVRGKFIVYRFMATYQGLSFTNKPKEFHDVIIVKTDETNKIVSGYQYTLEWAEPPMETDLYQSECKSVHLVDNMPIEKFLFVTRGHYDKKGRKLKDAANVKLTK